MDINDTAETLHDDHQTKEIENQIMEMIDNDETIDSIDVEKCDKKDDTNKEEECDVDNTKLDMMLTCCVPGCDRRFVYHEGYKFRWKDERQMCFWKKAIGRFGKPNKKPWKPTRFDRICNFHFIGKRASNENTMINYIPTKVRALRSPCQQKKINALMFKRFRFSYCWHTGWSITEEKGDDPSKVGKLMQSFWDQEFKDCRIICKDGDFIYCHSVILAMSSPILKKLLLFQEDEETKVLLLPDFSIRTVNYFIRQCYFIGTILDEKEVCWEEFQNLMAILKVKGGVSNLERKKSNRLAVKGAKTKTESPPRPEYEISKVPEVILVSHWNVAECCPGIPRQPREAAIECNTANTMFMDLKGCQDFITSQIINHPSWTVEKSFKNGHTLDKTGTVRYQKISSSITFKTPQVVVQRNHQNVIEEDHSETPIADVKQEIDVNEDDEYGELLPQSDEEEKEDVEMSTEPELPSDPSKEPFVIKMRKNPEWEHPCSFDCVTCNAKINTTISQHNLLVSKINGKMRGGRKKTVGVMYQCQKCQKNGIKPTKEDEKKSWGFVSPTDQPVVVKHVDEKKKEVAMKRARELVEEESGGVICSICGIHCKNSQFLEWHMNEHQGIKPFVCSECDMAYHSPLSLRHHKNNFHMKAKPKVNCPICPEVLKCHKSRSPEETIEKHKQYHHSGKETVQCDQCPFGSKVEKEVEAHISRCHESNLMQCDKCPSMVVRTRMKRHQIKHHDPKVPFECDQCQFRGMSQSSIISHKGRYHKAERIPCGNGCGQTFAQTMTMRWHMKRFCPKSTVKEDMIKREVEIGVKHKKYLQSIKSRENMSKKYKETLGTYKAP